MDIGPLRDFCVPDSGSSTFRRVYGLALRRVLGEMMRVGAMETRSQPRCEEVARLAQVIGRVKKDEPGALASLACLPTVSVFLRCLREASEPNERDRLLGELVATIALELALGGLLREPFLISEPPAEVLALGHRKRARVPDGERAIEISPDGAVNGAAVDEAAYEPVAGTVVLARADNNPIRMLEAHPDKQGNSLDFGGRAISEWTDALTSALDLIGVHLPAFRSEIDVVLRQFVPVGYDPEAHLSASYQEAIGTVYLSLHPSPLTMAEAVIHEVSHNKLNALFEVDPVILNDRSETYASPVRPDARPIHGVLLAVHAFLPVARLYDRMLEDAAPASQGEIRRHLERVRKLNAQGAEVLLRHGRPTAVGEGIFDEIDREAARVGG